MKITSALLPSLSASFFLLFNFAHACLPPGPCYSYAGDTPQIILLLLSIRELLVLGLPILLLVGLTISRMYKKRVIQTYKHFLLIGRDILIAVVLMFVIAQTIEFVADFYREYTV